MFDQIPHHDPNEADLPSLDADWGQIARFALTFDGYEHWGSFDKCAEIGNHWAAAYAQHQDLSESLAELRTCLFLNKDAGTTLVRLQMRRV